MPQFFFKGLIFPPSLFLVSFGLGAYLPEFLLLFRKGVTRLAAGRFRHTSTGAVGRLVVIFGV